jgi:hypothetical protein
MLRRVSASLVVGLVASICLVTLIVKFSAPTNDSSSLLLQLRRKLYVPFANQFPSKYVIKDLAQLSSDIYSVDGQGKTPQEAITDKSKWDFKYWLEAAYSTEAMIVKGKSTGNTVVVFRGSEELDDFLSVANILQERSRFTNAPWRVKIHQGFQGPLTDTNKMKIEVPPCNQNSCTTSTFNGNVVSRLEAEVLNHVGQNGEVTITGHSLGGVNAHYFAAYLADRNRNMKVTMINIGALRFGNDAFKTWTERTLVNLSAWRVVYDKDFAPRSPPNSFGYDHAGHTYQIWEGDYTTAYYRHVGGGNFEGVPSYWYYQQSISNHLIGTYTDHCKSKINVGKYWPTDFKKKPTCKWWQWWC